MGCKISYSHELRKNAIAKGLPMVTLDLRWPTSNGRQEGGLMTQCLPDSEMFRKMFEVFKLEVDKVQFAADYMKNGGGGECDV